VLAELLNCADFFVLGSRVETQCLAAIEACLCDVPVIMRPIGAFAALTAEERARVGVFGDDFAAAIDTVYRRSFSPRAVMCARGVAMEQMVQRWESLLRSVQLQRDAAAAARQREGGAIVTVDALPSDSPKDHGRTPRWPERELPRLLSAPVGAWGDAGDKASQYAQVLIVPTAARVLRQVLPAAAYADARKTWRWIRGL
jgi:hypothetical protein